KDYVKNPVVLWAHDHSGLPIAKSTKCYIDPNDGQLKSIDDFNDAASVYPFAAIVQRMIQLGLLNAVSVGFQPTSWEPTETGMNFLSEDLLEHSVCPVPAHPEALVIARSKGINIAPLQKWAERALDVSRRGAVERTLDEKLRRQFNELRVQSDPKGRKL